tara:strand:+ start:217 stop:1533 length:1317 start_codon:yes stop_codon:yes gene_type:complete
MGEAYNGMYLVEGNIDKIKDIVSKKSASKIDGVTVDMFTASAISQIYDKVNDANKKKMEKLPITKLAALAMKMMKNEYVPEELDLDEGTWHKAKDMSGLKKLMKKPILLGKDGDGATAAIAPYIGDDELYDDLFDAGKKDGPKADARPLIKNAMKRLNIKEELDLDEKKKEVVFKGTPAQIKKQMQNLKKKDKLKIGEEEDLDEKLDKDDETIVKKVVDKLKKASQAHAGQSKDLQKAIDEDGHTDVASAQNNVKVAMSALTKMSGELSKLNPEDALPSWWTNKVAVAVDKLDGMADYLDTQVEEVDLGERLDPADVDDDATDDDIKSADKNIMMQLRKSVSLRGNFPVEFMDKKKIRVPAKVAQAVQSKYNSLRKPNDKEKFQSQIAKSYKDMLGAIKEAVSPAQQAAIAISKKERGEKPKKESRFNTINKQLKGEK